MHVIVAYIVQTKHILMHELEFPLSCYGNHFKIHLNFIIVYALHDKSGGFSRIYFRLMDHSSHESHSWGHVERGLFCICAMPNTKIDASHCILNWLCIDCPNILVWYLTMHEVDFFYYKKIWLWRFTWTLTISLNECK